MVETTFGPFVADVTSAGLPNARRAYRCTACPHPSPPAAGAGAAPPASATTVRAPAPPAAAAAAASPPLANEAETTFSEAEMRNHVATPAHQAAVMAKGKGAAVAPASPPRPLLPATSGGDDINTSPTVDDAAARREKARRVAINVAAQVRLAAAIVAKNPSRFARSRERKTHVFCRICRAHILSTDVDGHTQGKRHIKELERAGHTEEADHLQREQESNGRLSGYAAVEKAVQRFGPIIRKCTADAAGVRCQLCHVGMNAVSAQSHIEGQQHKEKVAAHRAALKGPYDAAMERSQKRKAIYHGQFRMPKYKGERPESAGSQPAWQRSPLQSSMPEHYALLFKNDFPTPKQLKASRTELDAFARYELSTAVDWYDPLAPAGYLTEAGTPLEATADAWRALGVKAVHLQEASGQLEITGYNKQGTAEHPLDFKRVGGMTTVVGGRQVCAWSVTVPGVAENRPSVLRGDMINIHCDPVHPSPGRLPYTCSAFVHFVNDDSIVFELETAFEAFLGPAYRCSLAFVQAAGQGKRLVNAVEKVRPPAMLFYDTCVNAAYRHLSNYNPSAAPYAGRAKVCGPLNQEQRAFIDHVHGPHRLSVLWGPPGTGKTMTLVAAAVDTLLRARTSGDRVRILICAPSNEAADLVSQRIVQHAALDTVDHAALLMRIPGRSRDPRLIPSELLRYCPPVVNGAFIFPKADTIEAKSIIVTTLMSSDNLNAIGISRDHFTHLFVDEAGHATEQLLAIALNVTGATVRHRYSGVTRCRTKVVLAGDHKQLGPHVTVPALVDAKMHFSPLLRIFIDTPFWEKVGSQLLICYRSHPSIVHVVNAYYDDKLAAHSTCTTNPFAALWATPFVQRLWVAHCAKRQMPLDTPVAVPRVPILAINHSHPEGREQDSPSWMNVGEAQKVCEAVLTLWDTQLIKSFGEVAIITPYRKQVTKIRESLYSAMRSRQDLEALMLWTDASTGRRLHKPRVPVTIGTVDGFQGREARVVIVSCVRNNKSGFSDARFGLGFLSQPERANVALSRAKELLIVLGNKSVLTKDGLWAEYFSRMADLGRDGHMGGVVMDVAEDEARPDDDDDAVLPATSNARGAAMMAEEQQGVFRHDD